MGPLFTRFKPGKANADGTDAASKDLWSVWGALRAAGLVEYVGHIVEGLEDGSQAIHAYALPNQGEEEERQVALAAHEAGRAMLTKVNLEIARVALGAEPWLCPVRSHVTSVELVGMPVSSIARIRAGPLHGLVTSSTNAKVTGLF
jgi:hypothetical protein